MGKIKKKKKTIDPIKLEQIQFNNAVRTVFLRSGFKRIPVSGQEFKFNGRTGELDDIFLYENVLVICEYTIGKASSSHLGKKKFLFDEINADNSGWIEFLRTISDEFEARFSDANYEEDDYRVRIVYCSKKGTNEELTDVYQDILYLDFPQIKYFRSLTKIIHKSSRFEVFKFLRLQHSDIGEATISSARSSSNYKGFLLPEGFSSFPKGYKIVSFYADPQTLLEKSYVLRRDSWRDPDGLYQRLLVPGKIRNMRRYLEDVKRVFVNNIIVTLPSETKLNDPTKATNLSAEELKKVRQVSVQIPDAFNVIGIIDGQHRVFCYHEGTDAFEAKIEKLRTKQNLLVTGVIYPEGLPAHERSKFEAKLFLEINDTQARAKSALKQSIELILRPRSTLAIAKAIVERLSKSGALKDFLQVHQFDTADKIKTSSIVSYGLRPLVKFDGDDTLFRVWKHANKELLKSGSDNDPFQDALHEYVEFCGKQINALLLAAKMQWGVNDWKLDSENRAILSPTAINGFIVCLRLLVKHNKLSTQAAYENRLAGIKKFRFEDYRSSHWKALGEKLFETYFS